MTIDINATPEQLLGIFFLCMAFYFMGLCYPRGRK